MASVRCIRLRRPAPHEHPGLSGDDVVRLEHESRVHRPQFVGVVALGVVAAGCVVGIFVVALHAGSKGSEVPTAVSVLGSIASAAVGGIAGMLTGRPGADVHQPTAGAETTTTPQPTVPAGTGTTPQPAEPARPSAEPEGADH